MREVFGGHVGGSEKKGKLVVGRQRRKEGKARCGKRTGGRSDLQLGSLGRVFCWLFWPVDRILERLREGWFWFVFEGRRSRWWKRRGERGRWESSRDLSLQKPVESSLLTAFAGKVGSRKVGMS